MAVHLPYPRATIKQGLTGPRIAAAVISALILAEIAQFGITWRSLTSAKAGSTRPPSSPPPAPPAATPSALINRILAAHLFGQIDVAREDSPARAALAANLVLKGIMDAGDPARGFAIIAGGDGHSAVYCVGDPVGSDLRLQRVMRDYVLLAHAGRIERLELPRNPLNTSVVANLPGQTADTAAATALSADTQVTLRTFGLDVQRDPAGGIFGISGAGAPMWRESGLMPTDLIVAIDGRPIAEVLREPYAIDRAATAAVATLTVLRGGAEVSLAAKPQPAHVERRSPHQRTG